MQRRLLRIVSLIVLIAVAQMVTGLSAYVSATPLEDAQVEKAEKHCCNGCDDNEQPETTPCSAPDCPMFLCLTFCTADPSASQPTLLVTFSDHSFSITPAFKPFVKPVFHPPSIA